MRLTSVHLTGHRSVEDLEFEMGPFTVLFGKNNAGKTNILETLLGVLIRVKRILFVAPTLTARRTRRAQWSWNLSRGSRLTTQSSLESRRASAFVAGSPLQGTA